MTPQREQGLLHGYIMAVDDNPANLKLLEDMLRQQGYNVRSFPRGRMALAAAEQEVPDLILLDINMPEMNGYEVSERLQSSPRLTDIPVIFLSALTATEDKVKAFRSGAVDYISKPFQFEEVHARVNTHLKLQALRRALTVQNAHLEETVAARTRELADANERLTILDRAKSDFLSLISHEFRTPLNGLLGVGELVLDDLPSTVDNNELRELFERSRQRMLAILDDALLLTQINVQGGTFHSAPVSVSAVLCRAREHTMAFAASRHVTLPLPSADLGRILGDEDWLVRALHALLTTAVQFSAEGGTVRLTHEAGADALRIIIESAGKTMPGHALATFFDIFSIDTTMTSGGDLGLGPAVAYRILSLFGASVSVENLQPSGIRLTVALKGLP